MVLSIDQNKGTFARAECSYDLGRVVVTSVSIATKFKKEQGIDVSYKTIQRVLAGQR